MRHLLRLFSLTCTSSRRMAFIVMLMAWSLNTLVVTAQTTVFSYQGNLVVSGSPANGNYDFLFLLFDALSGGTQQGATASRPNVAVTNGTFTVSLDFGANFPGADRFLEIRVKPAGGPTFTILTPRQQITSTPYAIKSLGATSADSLSVACVNCVTSGQIQSVLGSQVSGAIPVGSVPAGSGNYVQNTIVQQAASNFNISGNGTAGGTFSANIINATTQYNVGGNRLLSVAGTLNTFAGLSAGVANTSGDRNSFFGNGAGSSNTMGRFNSFFGYLAGLNNQTGDNNSFFGNGSAALNTTSNNSFFGAFSGNQNQTGANNASFGYNAGAFNTSGFDNSIFGSEAGLSSTGAGNAFFGREAGKASSAGNSNTFIGAYSGRSNTASNNVFVGTSAGLANTTGTDNVFIGVNAGDSNTTGSFNSFFGRNAGQANTDQTGNSFFGWKAGAGSTGPGNSFFGYDTGSVNSGDSNSFFGASAGQSNTTACCNSFFGSNAGRDTTSGLQNTFIGIFAGQANTTGGGNTIIGANAGTGGIVDLINATAIGYAATVTQSNSFVLGGTGANSVKVGIGTTAPTMVLDVRDGTGAGGAGAHVQIGAPVTGSDAKIITFGDSGCGGLPCVYIGEQDADDRLVLRAGRFRFQFGSVEPEADGSQSLGGASNRWNTVWAVNGTIQTSDARLKRGIVNIGYGLADLMRLRPVIFEWKDRTDGRKHLGLIAQEVEPVIPEVIERSSDPAAPIGMNYAGLVPVLVKAIQQQERSLERKADEIKAIRAEAAAQQEQLGKQRQLIESMKHLVCLDHPNAEVCRAQSKDR